MNAIKTIKNNIRLIEDAISEANELGSDAVWFDMLEEDLWHEECLLNQAMYQRRMGMVVTVKAERWIG